MTSRAKKLTSLSDRPACSQQGSVCYLCFVAACAGRVDRGRWVAATCDGVDDRDGAGGSASLSARDEGLSRAFLSRVHHCAPSQKPRLSRGWRATDADPAAPIVAAVGPC